MKSSSIDDYEYRSLHEYRSYILVYSGFAKALIQSFSPFPNKIFTSISLSFQVVADGCALLGRVQSLGTRRFRCNCRQTWNVLYDGRIRAVHTRIRAVAPHVQRVHAPTAVPVHIEYGSGHHHGFRDSFKVKKIYKYLRTTKQRSDFHRGEGRFKSKTRDRALNTKIIL